MTFWPSEVSYPVTMQQCNGKVHFKSLKYCFPITTCNGNAAETSIIRSIPVTDRPDPGSGKDNFQPDLVTPVLNWLLNSVGSRGVGSPLHSRTDYVEDVGTDTGIDLILEPVI